MGRNLRLFFPSYFNVKQTTTRDNPIHFLLHRVTERESNNMMTLTALPVITIV